MRVIAVANQKGGVGKTATAVSLASLLGQRAPTLLVDLDPQGHCSTSFGLDSGNFNVTIAEVLLKQVPAREALRKVRDQLDLIPSNRDLAIAEIELRDEMRREERLKLALAELGEHQWVILDCPPNLGTLVINALVAADSVLVPISTTTALDSTTDLFAAMARAKDAYGLSWEIKVLQTFYRQGVLVSERLREVLEK